MKTYIDQAKQTSRQSKPLLTSAITISLLLLSAVSFAEGGSVHHSGQASKHSVLALSEGVKTSARVVSGVVAVPIVVVGGLSTAAGTSVTALGESIASGPVSMYSIAHHHEPLRVTELVITADPAPNKVTITSKTREVTTQTKEAVIETQ